MPAVCLTVGTKPGGTHRVGEEENTEEEGAEEERGRVKHRWDNSLVSLDASLSSHSFKIYYFKEKFL